MIGIIRSFSIRSGSGHITGENSIDYYFSTDDIINHGEPGNGDTVEYEVSTEGHWLRAVDIRIIKKAIKPEIKPTGDRAMCTHCGKLMIPRMVMHQGFPQRSFCPFCGGLFKSFGPCFIATAVYGDFHAPEVVALRRFRDEFLQTTIVGRFFISTYYALSPPVARYLARHKKLSMVVRIFLDRLSRRYL